MRKKWIKTTRLNAKEEASPNSLNQNFRVNAPNETWVSDITYVSNHEGWLYVAFVMDLFSRKVIGLSMGNKLEMVLVKSFRTGSIA